MQRLLLAVLLAPTARCVEIAPLPPPGFNPPPAPAWHPKPAQPAAAALPQNPAGDEDDTWGQRNNQILLAMC